MAWPLVEAVASREPLCVIYSTPSSDDATRRRVFHSLDRLVLSDKAVGSERPKGH